MKNKQHLFMLMAAAAVMACSPENLEPEVEQPESNQLSINAKIHHDKDRLDPEIELERERTEFQEGDVISVQTENNEPVLYTLQGQKWVAEEGKDIEWQADEMDVYAVTPATAAEKILVLPLDQSKPETKVAADIMTVSDKLIKKRPKQALEFFRQTARVRFKFDFAPYFKEMNAKITSVNISANTQIGGQEDVIGTYTMLQEGDVYSAIVAETNQEEYIKFITVSFDIDDNGTTSSLEQPLFASPVLLKGKCYSYHFLIGENSISLIEEDYSEVNWEKNRKFQGSAYFAYANPETHEIHSIKEGYITTELIKDALNGGNSLKIIGPINGTDLKAIRDAAGSPYNAKDKGHEAIIKKLDLKECQIVSGGLAYASMATGEKVYTENDHLGYNAFQDSGLESIIVPESLTSIDDDCFALSTKLSEFQYGENVRHIGSHCFNNCTALEKFTVNAGVKTVGLNYLANTNITTLEIAGDYSEERASLGADGQYGNFNSIDCDLIINETWKDLVSFGNNGEKYFGGAQWKSIPIDKPVTPDPPLTKPHAMEFSSAGILAGKTALNVQSVTLEAEVMFASFENCNTVLGKENVLLLRVGDVLGNPRVPKNQIQIAGLNIPFFHVEDSNFALTTMRWYHLAFTYSHITGNASIYIDGERIVTKTWPTNLSFNLGGDGTGSDGNGLMVGKIIGYRHGERPLDGFMRNVRVWSVERDLLDLLSGREKVSPDSEGLEVCYKLDNTDIEGSTVKDAAGKRDGELKGTLSWTEYAQ